MVHYGNVCILRIYGNLNVSSYKNFFFKWVVTSMKKNPYIPGEEELARLGIDVTDRDQPSTTRSEEEKVCVFSTKYPFFLSAAIFIPYETAALF